MKLLILAAIVVVAFADRYYEENVRRSDYDNVRRSPIRMLDDDRIARRPINARNQYNQVRQQRYRTPLYDERRDAGPRYNRDDRLERSDRVSRNYMDDRRPINRANRRDRYERTYTPNTRRYTPNTRTNTRTYTPNRQISHTPISYNTPLWTSSFGTPLYTMPSIYDTTLLGAPMTYADPLFNNFNNFNNFYGNSLYSPLWGGYIAKKKD